MRQKSMKKWVAWLCLMALLCVHCIALPVALSEEEAPAQPASVSLYRVQGDERLWDVMKRYRLSRASLETFNEQLAGREADAPLPAGMTVIAYKR